MVWARTKLVVQDDLLRPRNKFMINFKGPHPEKFYHEIPKLLTSVFKITEDEIQEKKIIWSHGDPEKFRVVWEMNKELDALSYYNLEIEFEGFSSKGLGEVKITIIGLLVTEYPQDTVWQKSLLYEMLRIFWHKTLYLGKRNEYIGEGRRLLTIFIDELKEMTRGG